MTFKIDLPQVTQDMQSVDIKIRSALSVSRYSKEIRLALDYLVQIPGKRLRPLLAIISYRSVQGAGALPQSVIRLAAAIELIHMASLVHDDIIDDADLRHGEPSFFKQFGIEVAIPVGVMLYSISLKLLSDIGDVRIISKVSRAVDQLCGGELDQVLSRNQFDVSLTQYLLVLKKKTSALFSLAMWGGVVLAGEEDRVAQSATHFGTALGLLFQISDDLMDFTGKADALLKGANQDFLLGEITLPLIILLDRLDGDSKVRALKVMREREWAQIPWLIEQFESTDVEAACIELMSRYSERCGAYISRLPVGEYRELLSRIVRYIVGRGRR